MTALTDAALDHAAMSEALLTRAAEAQEQIAYNRQQLAVLRENLGDELQSQNPDWADYQRKLGEARDDFDAAVCAAQVHATLACAPTQLEAVHYTGELSQVIVNNAERRASADVRQGDRVIMVDYRPEARRTKGTHYWWPLANDTVGTVVTIGPEADALAIVDWDDLGTDCEPTPVSHLRVVLGA